MKRLVWFNMKQLVPVLFRSGPNILSGSLVMFLVEAINYVVAERSR